MVLLHWAWLLQVGQTTLKGRPDKRNFRLPFLSHFDLTFYTSGSVAENSGSAWQGAKISASANILAPTELHLVHNSINTTSG